MSIKIFAEKLSNIDKHKIREKITNLTIAKKQLIA